MKKLLSLLLVCCLIMGICTTATAAEIGVFDTTKSFLAWLSENDLHYNYMGVNDNNRERITVKMNGNNCESFNVECFFYEDNQSAAMYVWNIIEYHQIDLSKVLYACNELNSDYRFVSFYCDESDNTVTAQTDAVFSGTENAGEIAGIHFLKLINIVDEGYPTLSEYGQ